MVGRVEAQVGLQMDAQTTVYADLRKVLRKLMFDEGVVVSRKMTDAVDEQEKFKMYYDYKEPAKTIPSHRMLAIRRGESENVLYFLIEIEAIAAIPDS